MEVDCNKVGFFVCNYIVDFVYEVFWYICGKVFKYIGVVWEYRVVLNIVGVEIGVDGCNIVIYEYCV